MANGVTQYCILLRNVKLSEWQHIDMIEAGTLLYRTENSLYRDHKYLYTSCDHLLTTSVYLHFYSIYSDLQYLTLEQHGLLFAIKDFWKRLNLLCDQTEFRQRCCIVVGDIVEVTSPRSSTPLYGVVKYRGPLKFEKGIWFGVELEEVSVYRFNDMS